MPHDRWRVLRGVAGAAGLFGAVAGVPAALVSLGQPLPAAPPQWPQVVDGLGRPISDSTLLRAAGVLCWLVWAAFVMAVVFELAGGVGAAAAGRRRALRVPGLQRLAGTLVLSAALLLPQRGFSSAPAWATPITAPEHHRPAVVEREADEDSRHERAERPVTPATPRPATSSMVRYIVQRYDSPWAIAERHLGDGTRWRELRDVEGRSLEGSSGERHPPGGARFIHAGDVLLVPDPDTSSPASARVQPMPGPQAPPMAVPTSPAGPAAPAALTGTADTAPAGPTPTATPAGTTPTVAPAAPGGPTPTAATALAGPTATRAGSTTTAAPAPSGPPPPTMRAVPGPDNPANGQRPPEMLNVTSERRPARRGSLAGTLLEAGMAGAAVLALLGVLRRRQAQHRPPGRRIRLPGPQLAGSELAIRRAETADRAALVASAIDHLADSLEDRGVAPPAVLGALVDDDAVEVLLDRPAPAPAPWVASAEGFRWRIGSSIIDVGPSRRSAPLPALVSLGRVAAGGADVLINLEAAGLVAITGEPARATGVLHGLATHLCGAPWAGAVDMVLIGMAPGLALADRVRTATSVTAVRDELRSTGEIMSATMADHDCADAFEGRVRRRAGDGWPPTVVLSARPVTAEESAWLTDLARPGRGVAAVVCGPVTPGSWTIDADASPMPVDPLRLAVQPPVLDQATMVDIGRMLEVAADDSGATLADPPYDQIDLSVESVDVSAPAPTVPAGTLAQRVAGVNGSHRDELPTPSEPEILVRVLGTVDVDGAGEFRRAKGRELVVYLAMHPHGVGEAELDEALWPSGDGRIVSPATRDSTVSVARRALGGPAGLLPAQGQGREKRYQLGPGVQSDWGRFCVLHRWGRDRSSVTALRTALEAVRGRPFEGVVSGRTYGWIHTEGHGRHIEAEVGDAADLMARLALEAGDGMAARWAARQGLMADPYCERLWVRLMEAADALGESQEIERVMDELGTVLDLEGDFSGLHPNTLAAYDRLSRRRRFSAAR